MPVHRVEDDLYRIYDAAVAETLGELSGRESIRLALFDRKNEEHLFILRVALMARDLYQVPVEICCGWWEGLILNWKLRKGFQRVKILKPYAPHGIWTPSLVAKIKYEIRKEYDICIHLDNIYRAYYEGSLN